MSRHEQLTQQIAENVAEVRQSMADAAQRAARQPAEIRLIAVTKTFPSEVIRAAYTAGLREFGENRVQEFQSKLAELNPSATMPEARFHMIGHVQSNKAAGALEFDWIQTIDSAKLARRLNELAGLQGKRPRVLLQIKLGEELAQEDRKTGAGLAEASRIAELLDSLPHLDPQGLMLIPPYMEDPEGSRPFFRHMREIRDRMRDQGHGWARELSMGMSHDFPVAIEEGATMIRVGTALFGPRTKS
jgi:pyridoxal phosphate enzyme (YggS family)